MSEYISINELADKNVCTIHFKPNRNIKDLLDYDYTLYLMYMEAVKRIYNYFDIGETECWDYYSGEKKLRYTEYHIGHHFWDTNTVKALETVQGMMEDVEGDFKISYFGGNTAFVYLPAYYIEQRAEKLKDWLE